jgi:hypothetical protein
VASLTDPQNDRCPRYVTPWRCDSHLVRKVSACAHSKPWSLGGQAPGRRSSAGGQGRKPAEPGARSASLDRLTPSRHRSPKRSWLSLRCLAESRAQGAPAVAERIDPQGVFVPRASSAPRRLAAHLSKINSQTNTCAANRPQRPRRFYLAVVTPALPRSCRPPHSAATAQSHPKTTGTRDLRFLPYDIAAPVDLRCSFLVTLKIRRVGLQS